MANELRWLVVVAVALVAGLFLSAPTATLLLGTKKPIDLDQDRVPDATEQTLCGRALTSQSLTAAAGALGRCDGNNWLSPERVAGGLLPIGIQTGEDLDMDGFPASIDLQRIEVDVNPFREIVLRLETATSLQLPVDSQDADPNIPTISQRTIPVDVLYAIQMGADEDYDGLPSTVTFQMGHLLFDRREIPPVRFLPTNATTRVVDEDDKDPEKPATSRVSIWVPIRAHHTMDSDRDYVPGSITVHGTTVTVDRRTNAQQQITTEETSRTLDLDPDDKDRSDVIPFEAFDGDADETPDRMESVICLVQDRFTAADGICVRTDGTGDDGSGENYIPPTHADSPWSLRVETTSA